jgi:hypothetical protein
MRKNITFLFFCISSIFGIFSQNVRVAINLTDKEVSVASYTDKEIVIDGQTDLHLTATTQILNNSVVKLNSPDSWVFFDNIRPQVVADSLLQFIYINNNAAVLNTNVRVSKYKSGAVVIPQSASFQPLKVYSDQNFTGDSASYSMFTFYNSLGTMDNKIRSFKLKRGYMATFANTADGTGYSRVFIADDKDLEIPVLSNLLDKTISFIRVLDWEWVTKKGWCGYDPAQIDLTKTTWRYDWSAGGSTTSNVEYVPIRQNGGWPGWADISGKQYVSHVLGFNEPDHTEQSNLTVSQAVAQWPDMLRTGLRIGSPACTNFNWLYSFLDSCKAKNYRVDYVAVHAYWNSKSPQNWYNDLKYIHDMTGRPIWITEWNNGANWTNENWPDNSRPLLLTTANAAKQLADIKGILQVLDTASFIERYSIYNWVEDARAMVLNGTLTPAGQYYANDKSVMAFNRKMEVIPGYVFNTPSLLIGFLTKKLLLTITDPNGDYYRGFILEKKIDDGSFTELYRLDNTTSKSYSDTLDLNLGSKFRYRVKAIYNDGTISAYSNEAGYDVTNNSDVQVGNVSESNIGWNPVLFGKPYTAIPAIILGSPTNNNSTVYMSARPRLVSLSSRFNVQLAPWSYQKVSALSKEETVPYFVIPAGTYDFGGLSAIANTTVVKPTWTTVTFATPFTTVPVVFVSELYPANTFATCVRVRNITATGFDAKIMKETAVTTALSALGETVSFFAITQGTGLIDGKKVIVGKTANTAVKSTSYTTINYGDSIANPVFLSQLQTCNDDTVTATLRCLSVTSKFSNVTKQREKSTGVATSLAESAGWMVINPVAVNTSVNTPIADQLSISPNPVKDVIYLNQKNNENLNVRIYNMVGLLVKNIVVEENKIGVSDLTPGCYILRTLQNGSNKFVKL